MVHVRQLHEKYGNIAQFLFIYISEPGHELPEELAPFAEPPDAPPGSRLRLLPRVRAGRKHFALRFPCLIDNEKGEVEVLYNAWPKRYVLVDTDGRVVLESGNLGVMPSFWKEVSGWLDHYSTSLSPQAAEKHKARPATTSASEGR